MFPKCYLSPFINIVLYLHTFLSIVHVEIGIRIRHPLYIRNTYGDTPMFDSLNRRSRFKRQPSGKKLTINQRDLDILALLYRYRYLTSHDLIAHIQPKSEKRFTERLGKIFHDSGLVDRPTEQWKMAGP